MPEKANGKSRSEMSAVISCALGSFPLTGVRLTRRLKQIDHDDDEEEDHHDDDEEEDHHDDDEEEDRNERRSRNKRERRSDN